MQRLYERFLDCGYTPELFYSLSVNETIDMIESYARRKRQREKEELRQWITVLDIFGSNLISKAAMSMKGENYTEASMIKLLPDENRGAQKGQPGLSGEMQLYKAQRIQHAFNHNRQRKGGKAV